MRCAISARSIRVSAAAEDVEALAATLKKRDMLLVLDVVVNHTSNEHEWAQQARQGEQKYQDYYYVFDDREIPDIYEETMPEIFPVTAPGNFTWDEAMGKWVMTVFNSYQWDLNYRNPAVLIEMIDIILFWANKGADILRLDAVAFLWKKMGSVCQNEREAHLLLQLMKDCCQVTAPGVLFIAEAIVAPSEIVEVFRRGRDQCQGMRDRLQRHVDGAALGCGSDQERDFAQSGHQEPARQAGTGDLA